jgi:signal transduction histidine kinase
VPLGWDARPWTALAAAAQGAGLLIELHALGPWIPMPLAVFACVGLVLPLALLWAAPLALTALEWLLAVGFGAVVAPLHASTAAIGLLLAVPFAVAALVSLRGSVLGLALCCLGGVVTFGDEIGGALIICVASWLAGRALRDRAQNVEQLRRNAALLSEQREAIARQSIVLERARLARDLHDAVGHSLTVVALQAGAARRLWNTDPGRAAEVLGTVAGVARDGLRELTGSLGIAHVTAPGPGVDSLSTLVAGARLAGLRVQAAMPDTDDVAEWADPDTCAVLYRILQESLTNVLKHAPEAAVRIALHRLGDHSELTVTNTAGRTPGGVGGSGHGLTGMRERVSAHGGRLDWSRQPDGRFTVHAQLPLAMAPA